MSKSPIIPPAIQITLWAAQVLLSLSLIWSGSLKIMQSPAELATMWPWTAQVSETLLRSTGVIDLLGAAGIILPGLLNIKPILTPITAVGIVFLMASALIFHIARGETSGLGVNIFFGLAAVYVAWGRFRYRV
ncbi:MAG: DoxX family protein [Chitinophagaceae bacterium]|nr:MAG: DoxX family protein [Chitinophagaceae bacterium]